MLLAPHGPRHHDCDDPGPVRVTVVVVLATTENTGVDPKLVELAREVQKRDPALIGFRLVSSEAKSIKVGDSATFPLVDKEELKVKVEKPKAVHGEEVRAEVRGQRSGKTKTAAPGLL